MRRLSITRAILVLMNNRKFEHTFMSSQIYSAHKVLMDEILGLMVSKTSYCRYLPLNRSRFIPSEARYNQHTHRQHNAIHKNAQAKSIMWLSHWDRDKMFTVLQAARLNPFFAWTLLYFDSNFEMRSISNENHWFRLYYGAEHQNLWWPSLLCASASMNEAAKHCLVTRAVIN